MGEGLIVRRGGKDPAPLVIEAGLIVGFFGLDNEVPFGWALCNGIGGTPNLQNMFIVGAGDEYNVESTGGLADAVVVEHTHTSSLASGENHTHNAFARLATGGTGIKSGNTTQDSTLTTNSAGAHTHTLTTDSTGISSTNTNLPPYYALIYIIKLEEN